MKKTLLLTFAVLFSVAVMAQTRTMLFSETFDGTAMPTGWSTSGMGTSNWAISASNNAGGSANEVVLTWSPQFNGISRLVTPSLDMTGISSIVVSFKHYLDYYSGSNTIGIATSSDGGTTWNVGWSQSYNTSGQYDVSQQITTTDMGSANVLFCIYFSGSSYNINNWYFDNINLFTLENLDLGITAINVDDWLGSGSVNMAMTVFNFGITTATSIEASYQIDANEPVVETFTTELVSLGSQTLTFTVPANLMPGSYNLVYAINLVNGVEDDIATNNSISKSISVSLGSAQKIPMIEHFSSSTCGPCVSVNTAMVNLTNNNPGKFTYTKYPMNWPGNGDPYYTAEGGIRRTFYGVNAVPQTFLDGEDQGYAAVTQNALDQHYAMQSFAEVRGSFNIVDNTISVIADAMSYVDLANVRVYVSVNEKTTTGNVGSNGETEFHHIMMKMLPDAEGTTLSIPAGSTERVEYTFDMSTTHVEEMNDLEVSVWIQDYSSKEILNSHFMYETASHPYPAENLILTENDNQSITASWEAPTQGSPVGYNIYVNGVLVAESTTDLSFTFDAVNGTYYNVEVQAVYGENMNSVKVIASRTYSWNVNETDSSACNLFPNPANNKVVLESEQAISDICIYNSVGTMVDRFNVNEKQTAVNVENYSNGVYFINIHLADGNNCTRKMVITH